MESQNIDYKQSKKDDYLTWICGFANAPSNTIFFKRGRTTAGAVSGLDSYDRGDRCDRLFASVFCGLGRGVER